MCINLENWKDIPGYEGLYEASSLGCVRSLPRPATKGKILKITIKSNGYLSLGLCRRGKAKTYYVHILIMLTFVGPRPQKYEVCHNDGNKQNCRLDNLRYDTSSANDIDKRDHGTSYSGVKHHSAKLNPDSVKEIRNANRIKGSGIILSEKYNVSPALISKIRKGQGWALIS